MTIDVMVDGQKRGTVAGDGGTGLDIVDALQHENVKRAIGGRDIVGIALVSATSIDIMTGGSAPWGLAKPANFHMRESTK